MKLKSVLFLVLLIIGSQLSANIGTVRSLFSKASENETSNERLIELTENATINSNPVMYAYYAGGLMTMANHVFWPMSKLEYFNDGKEKLENVIRKYPKNVEIRFIRFSIQVGAPIFLDYTDDLETDKAYILANMNKTSWSSAYKEAIKKFLNEN